jgi:hypothetical protein
MNLQRSARSSVPVLGAGQVYDAIVAAHAAPEWCVLSEVADATSGRASRRADAVAMNMWASRNLEIRGFEIKVSRSDLKRELVDPSKADAVGKYCHTWCLATPTGLVRSDDLVPASWGIFEVGEDGLGRFKRLPTSRPAEEVSALSRMFAAALVRAASDELTKMRTGGEWIRRQDIQAKLDAEFQRGISSAPNEHRHELRDAQARLESLQPIVDELGIKIGNEHLDWNAREIHVALKIGKTLATKYGVNSANRALQDVERALDGLKDARDALAALATKEG